MQLTALRVGCVCTFDPYEKIQKLTTAMYALRSENITVRVNKNVVKPRNMRRPMSV